MLVADQGADAIQQFDDTTGKYLGVFGQADAKTSGISYPMGIAVDAQGIVYVANLGTSQILRFTKEGLSLGIFGQASRAGSGLRLPNDIAFDSAGSIYVTGFKDNALNPQQVLKYNSAGVFTGIFASGIGGNYGYNGIAINANDQVFVSVNGSFLNAGNDHILKFANDGTPLRIFGAANDTQTLLLPLAMTFSSTGELHAVATNLTASDGGEVYRFNASGAFLGTVGNNAATILGPGVNGAGLAFGPN